MNAPRCDLSPFGSKRRADRQDFGSVGVLFDVALRFECESVWVPNDIAR